MAHKLAGGVVLLLLAALLLSSSADAKFRRIKTTIYEGKYPACSAGYKIDGFCVEGTPIECSFQEAKNPSCGDGTCCKQCLSEGYPGWICVPNSNCTCMVCPALLLEHRPETVKLQKQGKRGGTAAGVGAV